MCSRGRDVLVRWTREIRPGQLVVRIQECVGVDRVHKRSVRRPTVRRGEDVQVQNEATVHPELSEVRGWPHERRGRAAGERCVPGVVLACGLLWHGHHVQDWGGVPIVPVALHGMPGALVTVSAGRDQHNAVPVRDWILHGRNGGPVPPLPKSNHVQSGCNFRRSMHYELP